MIYNNYNHLLESYYSVKNFDNQDVTDIINWLNNQRSLVNVEINKIAFSKLQNWNFNTNSGNLSHATGKFFSIEGIEINTNYGIKSSWSQPIINQPEIGILGILTKNINGITHFLLQAKIEPGNINFVQLSPTLQATKSNYTQVHGGNIPLYLEYFISKNKNIKIISDQLQSEQGARFFKKRNRNIIIEVFDDVPLYNNFIWVTFGQIKKLIEHDNILNMDTRTVFSSLNFSNFKKSNIEEEFSLHNIDQLIAWITNLKTIYELNVNKISLNRIVNWVKDDFTISHIEKKYFSICAVDVKIENREVNTWSQPIIESAQEGIIGFIVKRINNVYHFLVQAKIEAGNFDILELSPTVQCLTGAYKNGENEYPIVYLDFFIKNQNVKILHDSYQSEEGGRFYMEQNRNMIVEVLDDFAEISIPNNYIWMTYNQLMEFMKFNNYLNIQARTLISCINFLNE